MGSILSGLIFLVKKSLEHTQGSPLSSSSHITISSSSSSSSSQNVLISTSSASLPPSTNENDEEFQTWLFETTAKFVSEIFSGKEPEKNSGQNIRNFFEKDLGRRVFAFLLNEFIEEVTFLFG